MPEITRQMLLGSFCKYLEYDYDKKLPHEDYWIVRLDGRTFSTFTRGFNKPCDWRILTPMILTTQDLVEEFHASLGYVQSDEITLVFPIEEFIN